MSEASPAVDGAAPPISSEQGEVALVERRRVQRRHAGDELVAGNSRDIDDRRLGPGRRLDDWRRRTDDASSSDVAAVVARETSA